MGHLVEGELQTWDVLVQLLDAVAVLLDVESMIARRLSSL